MKRFSILVVSIFMLFTTMAIFSQVKPKSIKLMVDGTFQIKENGEQVLVDNFKKLTGINLVLNHPIHNEYYVKVDLAFTTGDIPEVLILGGNQYVKYAQAGMLADLTALYNNSSFKKNIKDPSLVEALKINGKLYGIPFERGNGTITYVRGDWLEKLGMKAPTNYAEFLDMLRAFKNKNPDGLTPDQVIPITAAGLVNTEYPLDIYLREFYQNATPDFVQINGKWVDGMVQPEFAAAMDRMRGAYSEGLIDKEIITNKTSTARDKWNSGKVGVFNYWAGQWNLNLQQNLAANVPQAKVTPIKAIKETKYIERPATVYAITKAAKDPKSIFKYFHEFVLDGGVGQTWATFGAEGTFYKVVDGKVQWLPSIQDPKKAFTKAIISAEIPVNKWNSRYFPADLISNSLEMFQSNSKAYGLIPFSEEANELVPDLNFIRTKYVTKIVFGEITVKEGMDAYAKEAGKYTRIILKELNQKK
jgi:putative aldouronate transport system substrate-binding protein